jgi:hypothetical protein
MAGAHACQRQPFTPLQLAAQAAGLTPSLPDEVLSRHTLSMKLISITERIKMAPRKVLGKIVRSLLRSTGYELDVMEQGIHDMEQRIHDRICSQAQQVNYKLQQLERNLLAETIFREELSLRTADSLRHLTSFVCKAQIASPAPLLKISVILPVYNRAHMVSAAIQSVLDQSGVTLELLVIDDGSNDDIKDAIGPFLSHPALRYVQLSHVGVCAARNHGLAASTGDIIVYLDSDNRMYADYLSNVAHFYIKTPDADCAFAAMLWDDGRSRVHLRHDTFDWEQLLAGDIIMDLNCFSHRRGLWAKLGGFDENLTKHSDLDLMLRYTKTHEPSRIPAIAAHYNCSFLYPRITNTQPSCSSIARIRSKHSTRE